MINSIIDLQQAIQTGVTDWSQYGNVRAVYNGNLVLFNYTHAAQFEGRWNWFERASRGLILNAETAEVVARPFDKFFNWGENGRRSDGRIVDVTEKLDGSLGTLYRSDGTYKIATRGSFESDQALWATDFLLHNHGDVLTDTPDSVTLIFEIIYPENRIVVDYGGQSALFLLAIRNRHTGEYWPSREALAAARYCGFPHPKVYEFNDVNDIIELTTNLDGNNEGWVAEFSDGQRFKFKGTRYKELHRLVTQTSFKHVVAEIANGTFDSTIAAVPDELLAEVREWEQQIKDKVAQVKHDVETAFTQAPKNTRKEFALWVNTNAPELASYLFKRLDGQDYELPIYQKEF